MRTIRAQRGASLISWLLVAAALGFAFTVGLRLVPLYLKAYTVESVLEDTAAESRGMGRNPDQIWSSISKRLDINDIDYVKREHFSYKTNRGVTTIGIKYEARTKLIGNLDAVASFHFAETLAGADAE